MIDITSSKNQRLVKFWAYYYYNRCSHPVKDINDFLQDGQLGLLHAYEKYEPQKEIKFSTYAVYWIRAKIQRCAIRYNYLIRESIHKKTKEKYLKPFILYDDDQINVIDYYVQDEQNFDRKILISQLKQIISTLPFKQRYVINQRFFYQKTLEEISKKLNVTRERVRQIEKLALIKIKEVIK